MLDEIRRKHQTPRTAHSPHAVHLPSAALLIVCTVCGTGGHSEDGVMPMTALWTLAFGMSVGHGVGEGGLLGGGGEAEGVQGRRSQEAQTQTDTRVSRDR